MHDLSAASLEKWRQGEELVFEPATNLNGPACLSPSGQKGKRRLFPTESAIVVHLNKLYPFPCRSSPLHSQAGNSFLQEPFLLFPSNLPRRHMADFGFCKMATVLRVTPFNRLDLCNRYGSNTGGMGWINLQRIPPSWWIFPPPPFLLSWPNIETRTHEILIMSD